MKRLLAPLLCAAFAATLAHAEEGLLLLPKGVTPPPVPADNPLTAAKVALGQKLFFDKRLSKDGSIACASCHDPAHGFADPRDTPTSAGFGGFVLPRNSPTVLNVAY